MDRGWGCGGVDGGWGGQRVGVGIGWTEGGGDG